MGLFRRRRDEPLYAVHIQIYKKGGRYRTFRLIGPMRHEDAEQFAQAANDAIAREWGEALNVLTLDALCEAQPLVSPTDAGHWVRKTIELLLMQKQVVSLLPPSAAADGWSDSDGDGIVSDTTGWRRPPLPRSSPPTEESDESNDE